MGPARLWDPVMGTEIAAMSGHAGPVNIARFSPNGERIATGDAGGIVRLWDASTSTEKLILRDAGPSISAMAFSPDGGRLAVLSADQMTRVYAVDLEDLLELARDRVTRSLTNEECRIFLQQETCPEGVGL